MLRMGFLACDFHPLLLVLAEHGEFQPLIEHLRVFAETGQSVDLHTDDRIYAPDVSVRLVDRDGANVLKPGLSPLGGDPSVLEWALTRSQADDFAEQIANLAASTGPAGSVTLACDALNEVRVVVSYGEWDDDFLTA